MKSVSFWFKKMCIWKLTLKFFNIARNISHFIRINQRRRVDEMDEALWSEFAWISHRGRGEEVRGEGFQSLPLARTKPQTVRTPAVFRHRAAESIVAPEVKT